MSGAARIADVVAVLEQLYDPRWAESWDAVGLVAGDPEAAAYAAGGPVRVSGEQVWRAMFDERHPDAWEQFLRDETTYVVTGLDMVQACP